MIGNRKVRSRWFRVGARLDFIMSRLYGICRNRRLREIWLSSVDVGVFAFKIGILSANLLIKSKKCCYINASS